MKKKAALISIVIVGILILFCFVGTGFCKRTNVVLVDYSVSADGSTLRFTAGVETSMGFVRGFEDRGGGVKPHYLTFYAAFGGLNSSLGAKNEFVLPLEENDREIYFNRSGGGYELVLRKNEETGEWEIP